MKIIVTSQSTSYAAWMASGGVENLGRGIVDEQDFDDDFLDWLRRSGPNWTITTSGSDDSIVISHWNEVEIETMRTTIDCNPDGYNEVLSALKTMKASFQQRDRERAGSSLLCTL